MIAAVVVFAVLATYLHWRIRRPPSLLDDLGTVDRYRRRYWKETE
jgi:hypothetical protein